LLELFMKFEVNFFTKSGQFLFKFSLNSTQLLLEFHSTSA
jgi:hypothetical protein